MEKIDIRKINDLYFKENNLISSIQELAEKVNEIIDYLNFKDPQKMAEFNQLQTKGE